MSRSSYDELMKHLICLKDESSQIQNEIHESSKHLTKLELDTSNMKDRITHQLHQVMSTDGCGVGSAVASLVMDGDQDFERLVQHNGSADGLEQYCYEHDEFSEDLGWAEQSGTCFPNVSQDSEAGISNSTEDIGLRKLKENTFDFSRTVAVESCSSADVNAFQLNEGKTERRSNDDTTVNRFTTSAETDIACIGNNQSGNDGQPLYPPKLVTIATQTTDVYLPGNASSVHDNGDWQHSIGNQNLSTLYHGGWPLENGSQCNGSLTRLAYQDTASVMSFSSSNVSSSTSRRAQNQQLGAKVEMVYSLLSMLGTHDPDDTSRTLLAMSSSPDSCIAMRHSGCLPLLIQVLHGNSKDMHLLGNTRGSKAARARAAMALHNVVCCNPDNKNAKREVRVLRLLELIRAHCDQLRSPSDEEFDDQDIQPASGVLDFHHLHHAIASLMKLSYDEEHRHAICSLGGLQAIAELLHLDEEANGNTTEQCNILMRRHACMTLTNLTFGDCANKALLCSYKGAIRALIAQLRSANEDLCQGAACVLRNLSWHADLASKKALREVGSVVALTRAAMMVEKESTLKSILNALWNLSAHCSENKEDICATDGALKFLVNTLTYQSPTKTLEVIENGGGILRNISSHIAVCERYRAILRQHGCLQILLRHLESPSLKIVSNACGTLWNLSARCAEDQQTLLELGAINKLRNLVHSKIKMISMGSAAALKNLLATRPDGTNEEKPYLMASPGLHVRRQKALEAELEEQALSESCENIEGFRSRQESKIMRPRLQESQVMTKLSSASAEGKSVGVMTSYKHNITEGRSEIGGNVGRSQSQDSVGSTHSDISHDCSRIFKMNQFETPPESSDRQTDDKLIGTDVSGNKLKLGQFMQVMHDSTVNAGVQQGDYLHRNYRVKGPHSLESSPASHRRQQSSGGVRYNLAESRSGNYMLNPMGIIGMKPMNIKDGSSGKKGTYSPPEDLFSHLSPCMEKLHLTMPELDQEQDVPIDYTNKYIEVVQEPTGNAPVPASSAARPVTQPIHGVRCVGGQAVINQAVPSHRKIASFQTGGNSLQLPNSSFTNAHQVLSGRLGQPIPPGQMASIHSSASVKTPGLVQNQNHVSKMMFTRTNQPLAQGRIIPGFSRYGKQDLETEMTEEPTDYSIKFAEHNDEDDEPAFAQQSLSYNTRYTDRKTQSHVGFNLPETHIATCGFNDDTVTTFCTEGTPMNFLSTATSMNDLSCKGTSGGQRKVEASLKSNGDALERTKSHSDVDCSSVSGSQSTDNNTASTIVVGQHKEEVQSRKTITSDNMFMDHVVQSTHLPSVYSYKDSTGTSSPYEKPKQYCTEGTPTSFSHASSLSSLQIPEVSSDESAGRHPSVPKPGLTLPDIDENSSLDVMISTEIKTSKMMNEGISSVSASHHGTGGTTKTVTFDDNNQIQETPLMFSRCSSLGSLSSFDTHSVHSSVVSEYSRRASEVVSPSDLPDSPCDTMPPSPLYNKPDVAKFPANSHDGGKIGGHVETKTSSENKTTKTSEDNDQTVLQLPSDLGSSRMLIAENEQNLKFSAQSSPVVYADEGSVCGFSNGTSLSALTMDEDEGVQRIIPLGEEQRQKGSIGNIDREPEKLEQIVDDDDNSSVSESEENMLAECINMAMPSKSSKPMVHGSSDGILKQKQTISKTQHPNFNSTTVITDPSHEIMPVKSMIRPPQKPLFCPVQDLTGCDSPKKYATEDTPLNFSHSGSLGDLTATNDLVNVPIHLADKAGEVVKTVDAADDDNNSDVSCLSDSNEDYEGLLSEVIEAAMPKRKKTSSKNVPSNRLNTSNPVMRGQFPGMRIPKPTVQNSAHSASNFSQMLHPSSDLAADGVKTYAVEGTPIEFSRSTSLSNLTVESMDGGTSEKNSVMIQSNEFQGETRPVPTGRSFNAIRNPNFPAHNLATEDVIHSYVIENQKPNFPLYSLNEGEAQNAIGGSNCKGRFGERSSTRPQKALPVGNVGINLSRNKTPSKVKSGMQFPAVARLRAPTAGFRPSHESPTLTSTPIGKQIRSPLVGQEDQVVQYAVEGTPENVSRNLSPTLLSNQYPLASNDSCLESELDQSACFHVEDTPAQFSRNSSLSSLSLESLNSETAASDAALLAECINAAMPKSKKHSKKLDGHHPVPASPNKGSKSTSASHHDFSRNVASCGDVKGASTQKNEIQFGKSVSKHPRTSNFMEANDSKPEKSDTKHKYKDRTSLRSSEQHRNHPEFSTRSSLQASNDQHFIASVDKTLPGYTKDPINKIVDPSTSALHLTSAADVTKTSFPDCNSSALSDVMPDDDTFQSGSSTGANNTVIYHGPLMTDIPEVADAETVSEEMVKQEKDEQLTDYCDASADLAFKDICDSSHLQKTTDEHNSQLEEDANLILTELSMNCGSQSALFATNEDVDLFAEDCSVLLEQDASLLEPESGSEPEDGSISLEVCSEISDSRCMIQNNAPAGAHIIKPVNRSVVQHQQLTPPQSPKSIYGKTKLPTTRLLASPSSAGKSPAKAVVAIPTSNPKTKPYTPSNRRSPSGKSRSLSPAIRSQTSVKVLPGTRTSSRSSSSNSIRSQPPCSTTNMSSENKDSRKYAVTTVNASQQSVTVGTKVSPQVPPRTSSKLSTKSTSLPKSAKIQAVEVTVPSAKSGNISRNHKPVADAPKYLNAATTVSPTAKVISSGIPLRVTTNKVDVAEEGETSDSVAMDSSRVGRPKPPIKEGTFTKELAAADIAVIQVVRSEGVGGCDISESDSGSGINLPTGKTGSQGSVEDGGKQTVMLENNAMLNNSCTINEKIRDGLTRNEVVAMHPNSKVKTELVLAEVHSEKGEHMPMNGLWENEPGAASIPIVLPASAKNASSDSHKDEGHSGHSVDPIKPHKKQGFGKLPGFLIRDKKQKAPSSQVVTVPSETSLQKKPAAMGPGKSPKSFRKSFPVGRSKKVKSEEFESEEYLARSKEGITHSCTYDKIETLGELEERINIPESNSNPGTEEYLWRRTYTVTANDCEITEAQSSQENLSSSNSLEKNAKTDEKDGKKVSLSLWKWHAKDSAKEKSKNHAKDHQKEKPKDNGKEKSKNHPKENSKENTKENVKEQLKEKTKDYLKEKSKDLPKEKLKTISCDNSKVVSDDKDSKYESSKKKGFSFRWRDDSNKKNKNKEELLKKMKSSNSKESLGSDMSRNTDIDESRPLQDDPVSQWCAGTSGSSCSSRAHTPPSAVISPFISASAHLVNGESNCEHAKADGGEVSLKPLTKTEMLLARRNQAFLDSERGSSDCIGNETEEKNHCLITTV